jgi:hypothetical protein
MRLRRSAFILAALVLAVSVGSANIVGPVDQRGTLTVLGPRIGLTKADIARIRSATGLIACEGHAGSGVLIANRLVATNGHVLFDEHGRRSRSCTFKNQADPRVEVRIDPRPDAVVRGFFVTGDNRYIFDDDFAVARLLEPVRNAVPFRIDPDLWVHVPRKETRPSGIESVFLADPDLLDTVPNPKGLEVYVASATAADLQGKLDPDIPIVQKCSLLQTDTGPGGEHALYSDCSGAPGQSGSPVLFRKGSDLVVTALVARAGGPELDYRPFSTAPPNTSYTLMFALDATFFKAVNPMLVAQGEKALSLTRVWTATAPTPLTRTQKLARAMPISDVAADMGLAAEAVVAAQRSVGVVSCAAAGAKFPATLVAGDVIIVPREVLARGSAALTECAFRNSLDGKEVRLEPLPNEAASDKTGPLAILRLASGGPRGPLLPIAAAALPQDGREIFALYDADFSSIANPSFAPIIDRCAPPAGDVRTSSGCLAVQGAAIVSRSGGTLQIVGFQGADGLVRVPDQVRPLARAK